VESDFSDSARKVQREGSGSPSLAAVASDKTLNKVFNVVAQENNVACLSDTF